VAQSLFSRPHFTAAAGAEAHRALDSLVTRYGQFTLDQADVIVALGGDGHMLATMHDTMARALPIYGMNLGTIGFLMNDFNDEGLLDRLSKAETAVVNPLRMRARDTEGRMVEALAINEVSLLRETRQAAKIQVEIDGKIRLPELICDGILLATPAGSTAYNLSAHGPILPLDANSLALTPISAFRPRRWRGALLSHKAAVKFTVLEHDKRPVSAVADHTEVRTVASVSVSAARDVALTMLFDAGHSLAERILLEQFVP